MSEFVTTKHYDYTFKRLKDMIHGWYLNESGGNDSSWMIPHFEKLTTLEEVVKHNHKVFNFFVKHYGKTWGYDDDVKSLDCLSNNQLLRILCSGNVPKEDYHKYLVNLRPGYGYNEALQRIISLYPSEDTEDKKSFVKLSEEISSKAKELKELLFDIRCYGINTNGDKEKDKRRSEIVKEFKEHGYIASKYEDTDLSPFGYLILAIIFIAVIAAVCIGGFALLGLAIFFIPLITGKFK